MKITAVTTYAVAPRWLFVRIDTDEGVTGWGEPALEGRVRTVAAAVGELAELLVGADPLRIEAHWQVLTKAGFYRGGAVLASAVGGIDQALWDIAGKARGVPVHELLGGPLRDRVRVYSWIGGDGEQDVAEQAARKAEQGFTAIKMNASAQLRPIDTPAAVDQVVRRVAAVREVLGPTRDIAIDFHGRVSTPMARRLLPLLEPLAPMFVEEPILPEYSANLASIVQCTSIPIATGERLYSRWDFRAAFEAGIAVAQPDISHAGGISEVRRIAAQAETHDAFLAPHCPLGPVALASALQVDFAIPNLLVQEQSLGIHYNGQGSDLLDYLTDPAVFEYRDGWVERPAGPGLGIEVDAKAIEQAATWAAEHDYEWRTPIWRHDDGSLAEW
ncbi:galactonate dehydratase [Actinocrinis sp.]|uniref:galactonate dehydratase n=1 Tax=Actinocrinis sp. TaxID=1920516 RepID=UPI002D2AF125|nr:galactonate dehydratase [Actinocrinis sp.]HZP50464.1 galactonate dehydratase [Actinocrinis sp.]